LFNFSLNFTINPNYKNRYFKEHVHDDGNNIQIPFFVNLPNGNTTADLQRHLVEIVKYYEEIADTTNFANNEYNKIYDVTPQSQKQYNTTLENVQNEEFDRVKPQGGIYINSFDDGRTSDSIHFNYTVIANELSIYSVRGLPHVNLSGFNQSGAPSQGKFPLTGSYDVQRRNTLMNMVHNGILKYLLQQNGSSSFGDASQSIIKTFITPFFPHKTNMTVDITNLLGGVLYPFAASFLFPVFIAALAKDKFERHLIMMEQNGLNKMTYWIITYIFNYAIYLIIAIIITIVSILWQVRLFTQTSAAILVIVFIIWGHSQVVLGFFFANFFNNPRIATVTGYIFVIAGVLVSEMLQLVKIFPDDQTPFAIYMLYPPFAFYRILFYLIHACADFRCYGIDELSSANGLNLLNTAILYLTGSTILLLLVGIYLSYVLPSEYGVRKSPFFPIIAVYKLMKRLLCKMGMSKICNKREMLNPATGSKLHTIDNDSNGIDEDVLQEENMIESEFNFIDAPIVIFQLRKEYPSTGGKPANVAVESFSLAINRNECFGLLGPNGAGKTTLISVLTGLYEPSHGFAKVAGYDLVTQMSDIHHHLGVCPQFDIQYPDLTAEEHLLFYARLKGAKFCRAGRIVEKALKQVNLYDARKKKSKELSGGMRRRLSVAMACIGSPDILILDEPTTGLDPASRRQVWEVIERVKIGKSVILTTHAMEEADHLCTRIGIMNFGRLRCLGSQNRLKAKFGTGYQLKFHCTPGRVSDVERFIQVNLTAAKHVETFADMCTYQIEKEDVVVSQLFEMFDNAKDQVGIVDWGIKMTTLEDVFMTIVKSTSDNRTKLNNGWFGWLPCHNCYGKSS
jgi:ABC-type multidrug transport system ATPase subunit